MCMHTHWIEHMYQAIRNNNKKHKWYKLKDISVTYVTVTVIWSNYPYLRHSDSNMIKTTLSYVTVTAKRQTVAINIGVLLSKQ